MKMSKKGYKKNSPDRKNPFNIIPSGKISMKDVLHPVMGIDNTGVMQMMMPGGEYKFPGSHVVEFPMMGDGNYPSKQQGGPIMLTSPIEGDTTKYQTGNVPRAIDKTQSYDPMDKATREWNAWIRVNPVGSPLNPSPGIEFGDWRILNKYLPLEGHCEGPNCEKKAYGGDIKKYPNGGDIDHVSIDEQVIPGSTRHKQLINLEGQKSAYEKQQEMFAPYIQQFGQPDQVPLNELFNTGAHFSRESLPPGAETAYRFKVPKGTQLPMVPTTNATTIFSDPQRGREFYLTGVPDVDVPEYDLFNPYADIDMSLEPEPLYTKQKIPKTLTSSRETIKQKPGAWYRDEAGNWVQAPIMTTIQESGIPSFKSGGNWDRAKLSGLFKGMSKKAFNGSNVPQGMDTDDVIAKNRNVFTGYISSNTLGNLAEQEADELGMIMQMGGGFGYNPGMYNQQMYGAAAMNTLPQEWGNFMDLSRQGFANPYYEMSMFQHGSSPKKYQAGGGADTNKIMYPMGNYGPPVRHSQGETLQPGYTAGLSYIPGQPANSEYNMFPINFSPYHQMKGREMNFTGIPDVGFDPSQVYLKNYQYRGRLFGQGPRKVSMTFSPFGQDISAGETDTIPTSATTKDRPDRLSLRTRMQNFLQEQQAERERKRRMKKPEFETAVHPDYRKQDGGDITKLPTTPITKIPQNMEMPAIPNIGRFQGDVTLEWKRKMGINPQEAVSWGLAGLNTLSTFGESMDARRNQEIMEQRMNADALFQPITAGAASRGTYDPNTGAFRPNQMTPVQFSGMNFGQIGSPMSFKQGGEYDLSKEEIQQILAMGGTIEYID